jgi:cellulose synthase/poly-beta-1,6-N-acetylglucosamine synthase-like glycosyltransferase
MKIIPDIQDPLLLTLFWSFIGLSCFQFLYSILFFGRLSWWKSKGTKTDYPPVSIEIAARNESDNLYENLPKILVQNYPAPFEVVVVNHQSIDDSAYLLDAMCREYPNLVVMEVKRNPHLVASKKFPLTMGIKKAQYEHLLLTDADCVPASDEWLKLMLNQFTEKKQIVLGYGPYSKAPGFLNKVIRFDTTMIGVHYLSQAINRMPYMGVGRNLAYTKTVFNSTKGFKSHISVLSGDDDLFIQEAAKKGNYTIQIHPKSFQYSKAKDTWEEFTYQKSRHYQTAPKYKFIKKALLGTYPMTLILMLISFVILNLTMNWLLESLIVLGFVTLTKWWLLGRCFHKLESTQLIWALPVTEVLYVFIQPLFYYSTKNKLSSRWK